MAYGLKKISVVDLRPSTGVGVKIPFDAENVFATVYTTKDQTKYNLINFLLTDPRERPFNPTFGAGLRARLFEGLTGSGLGCDDWPNCNADRFVDVSSKHSAIEQLNRLFTFLVGLGVLLAAAAAWYRRPRRRDLVTFGAVIVLGVPAQGIVGAFVVWTDLHPAAVQVHFILSMVLVWAAVLLLIRSREPDGARREVSVTPVVRRWTRVVAVATAVTVIIGTVVTGTGPHAGDEEARRFFGSVDDIDGDALRWVTRIHGISVWITVASAVVLAVILRSRPGDRRQLDGPLTAWMLTAVVQGTVGYVQYAAGLPVGLVVVHLAGATTLVGVTAWLWNSTTRPVAQT